MEKKTKKTPKEETPKTKLAAKEKAPRKSSKAKEVEASPLAEKKLPEDTTAKTKKSLSGVKKSVAVTKKSDKDPAVSRKVSEKNISEAPRVTEVAATQPTVEKPQKPATEREVAPAGVKSETPKAPEPIAPKPAAPVSSSSVAANKVSSAPPVSPRSHVSPQVVHKSNPTATPAPVVQPVVPKAKETPRPPVTASHPVAPAATSSPAVSSAPESLEALKVDFPITVRDFATKTGLKAVDVIKELMSLGIFATVNHSIGFEEASKLAKSYGFKLEEPRRLEQELGKIHHHAVDQSKLSVRPPVVTFMGHVDHGKTSLLDFIRKTSVVSLESGGITQHIGAYQVKSGEGAITFLDTPGHEAFSAMRARGARCTDIVVLVVAADSGIMPQTREAIDHARAADVPIIVAINKIDLPTANIDRVKKQLTEVDLLTEDWGGKTVSAGVSAKTGKGVNDLMELLLLEAELLELKANPSAPARGTVLEAELSKGSGPSATLLVQDGTLKISDVIVCGDYYGRVRAMINDRGERIQEAGPSLPVIVLGLSGVPESGDQFYVVQNEVKARELINEKQQDKREKGLKGTRHVTLEDLYKQITTGRVTTLKLIIKADVHGSIEALTHLISQIQAKEVKLEIIHTGIGNITESDAILAAASDAIIIGFHVSKTQGAIEIIKRESIDVRLYDVIYEAKNDILKAMEGMLRPDETEVQIGNCEVRQVFKISKTGTIAGSFVHKGKILRNAICHVYRSGEKMFVGRISSLKRFKNDAREVTEGFECGIGVDGFSQFESGDEIRVFEIKKEAKTLNR